MSKLNPRITTVEVGIRGLREVTIYPLSLADQAKTARVLSKAFQEVMDKLALLGEEGDEPEGSIAVIAKQLSDVDIAEFIVTTIQNNLEIVLKMVVDESEKISMEELDNDQFYNLVETIYKVNYERASKNFIALWKGARGMVPLKKTPKKKVRRKVSSLKKSLPESVDGTITG